MPLKRKPTSHPNKKQSSILNWASVKNQIENESDTEAYSDSEFELFYIFQFEGQNLQVSDKGNSMEFV